MVTKRVGTCVRVRAKHIRAGVCADCFHCAVALALSDATGDDSANVWADWGILYLEVWGRSYIPERRVTDFIHTFDDAGDRDKKPDLPARLWGTPLAPFAFVLPPDDSSEWEEKCYHCEQLRNPKELDDEGVCKECRKSGD